MIVRVSNVKIAEEIERTGMLIGTNWREFSAIKDKEYLVLGFSPVVNLIYNNVIEAFMKDRIPVISQYVLEQLVTPNSRMLPKLPTLGFLRLDRCYVAVTGGGHTISCIHDEVVHGEIHHFAMVELFEAAVRVLYK
jgi:hypothetical protein